MHTHAYIHARTNLTLPRSKMLKMGASKPWPEAMQAITGQRLMKAEAIVSYFSPLNDFLERENKGSSRGWSDACPDDYFSTGDEDKNKKKNPNSVASVSSSVITIVGVLLVSVAVVMGSL